jgi:putative membrane protein
MRSFLVVTSFIISAFLALPSGVALAHAEEPLSPHHVWDHWNWDPLILGTIFLSGWLYLRGLRSLWNSAGRGRGVKGWQAAAFFGGLIALFIALISPIDPLSGVLFSAHMLQHMLLILVSAPLLILGVPHLVMAWALPKRWSAGLARWQRRYVFFHTAWKWITKPLTVWILHAFAITIWHIPLFYEAALTNELVHFIEHASFHLTALLFWWVVYRAREAGRLNYGLGMFFVFTMMMYTGLIGALITFSKQVWYPYYEATAGSWGITPLEDQQLAGAIMWVPGNFIYLIGFLSLMAKWFQSIEQRQVSQPSRLSKLRDARQKSNPKQV